MHFSSLGSVHSTSRSWRSGLTQEMPGGPSSTFPGQHLQAPRGDPSVGCVAGPATVGRLVGGVAPRPKLAGGPAFCGIMGGGVWGFRCRGDQPGRQCVWVWGLVVQKGRRHAGSWGTPGYTPGRGKTEMLPTNVSVPSRSPSCLSPSPRSSLELSK